MDEPQAIGQGVVMLCIGIAAVVSGVTKGIEAGVSRLRNGKKSAADCGANGKLIRKHCETLARHDEILSNMAASVDRIEGRVEKIADHLLDSKS